jgi:hypothetical protein
MSEFVPAIKRKVLDTQHLDYCGDYIERLRALYEGGKSLLHNRKVMGEIFPRHRQEPQAVYDERCKRAIYISFASGIVDRITAGLAADPVVLEQSGAETLPDWYAKFVEDVSPPGGERVPLASFARRQVTEMLVSQCAWARVDMPKPGEFASLGEQVRAGNLDAYVVPVPCESVWNFKRSSSGELEWVTLYDSDKPQERWDSERNITLETWTIWTRQGWVKYQDRRKDGEEVNPDKPIPLLDEGAHSFERVPLICTAIPKGLWAMDTLESPAREHFNKRSALAWGELMSLLPELYEFKGPEETSEPTSESQQDPKRDVNQKRGPGYVQRRGHQDKAQWIGPDSAPFTEARASLAELRDDMHRTMHMMAMSISQNATSLGRSAESKKEDRSETNIVLTALGQFARDHITDVVRMVSHGRKDPTLVDKWKVEGASQFETDSGDAIIGRAEVLVNVPVKSPTFQREVQKDVAKAWLGERAEDDKIMEIIEKEIDDNVTLDSMNADAAGGAIPKFEPAPGEEESVPAAKGAKSKAA